MPNKVFNNLLQNSSPTFGTSCAALKIDISYIFKNGSNLRPLFKSFHTISCSHPISVQRSSTNKRSGCVPSIRRLLLLQGKQVKMNIACNFLVQRRRQLQRLRQRYNYIYIMKVMVACVRDKKQKRIFVLHIVNMLA